MEGGSYYESLKAGLEDAAAFINGDRSRGRVVIRKTSVPEYQAKDIMRARKALNLSKLGFASVLGVSAETVEEWETGETALNGTARNLLYLIDNDHTLIGRLNPVANI